MYLWVCRFSLHLQATLPLGKNCLQNSPVYACPVQQCTRWPNTLHWSLSSVKCFCGIEGWWDSVGDGKLLFLGHSLPVTGPCCVGGGLDSTGSKFSGCPYCVLQASCVASLAHAWPLIIVIVLYIHSTISSQSFRHVPSRFVYRYFTHFLPSLSCHPHP